MDQTLFFLIFSLFTITYTMIGILASRKINSITDYFLAGRNLGLFNVMFSLIAAQLGGGMLLGTAQEAYTIGIYGIMYSLGVTIGFLLLGAGVAGRLQSFNVATVDDLFEMRYNSKQLKKFAAILSIITMSGILVGQIVGARILLTTLGFFHQSLFIGFWLLVILHTVTGGLRAVVFVDTFQVIFIIIVLVGIFIYSVALNPFEALSTFGAQKYFTHSPVTMSLIFSTMCMPALFSLIEQDLAQRFFASRSKKIAIFAALGAAIFMLFFAFIPIYFGMKAQLLGISVGPNQSPLIPVLQLFTNDYALALAMCAIIAAITSTADSLLCAMSSLISLVFNPQFASTSHLIRSKIITLLLGITALAVSYIVPQNIIHILIESYAISVSCLFVPLIFCYFTSDVKKEAAYGGVAGGLVGLIIFSYITTPLPKELLALVSSLCGYLLGILASRLNRL